MLRLSVGETIQPGKSLDIIIDAKGATFVNGKSFPADAKNYEQLSLKKPEVDAIYQYLSSQTVTRDMLWW